MPPHLTGTFAINGVYMRCDLETELAKAKSREGRDGAKTRSASSKKSPLRETSNVLPSARGNYRHLDPRLNPWAPGAGERWSRMLASDGIKQSPASSTTASTFQTATDSWEKQSRESADGRGAPPADSDDFGDTLMSPKHAAERELSVLSASGALFRTKGVPRISTIPDRSDLQSGAKLVLRSPRKRWTDPGYCPESPNHVDTGPLLSARSRIGLDEWNDVGGRVRYMLQKTAATGLAPSDAATEWHQTLDSPQTVDSPPP